MTSVEDDQVAHDGPAQVPETTPTVADAQPAAVESAAVESAEPAEVVEAPAPSPPDIGLSQLPRVVALSSQRAGVGQTTPTTNTGARLAEFANLHLNDVDLTTDSVRYHGKRNKDRRVRFGHKAA